MKSQATLKVVIAISNKGYTQCAINTAVFMIIDGVVNLKH